MRLLLQIAIVVVPLATSCAGSGQTSCGDRFLDGDETCDDGNTLPGDGCDPHCQLECGNGVLDVGEECEDSNREPDDGCDERCRLECGNGVLDGGEECEVTLTPNDCTSECRWEPLEPDIDLPEPGSSTSLLDELTAASPVWGRPNGSCDGYSLIFGDCPWKGYVLLNRNGRSVTVTIDALAGGTGDGTLRDSMLFLYEGAWPPHDSLACLASNDDGGEGRDAMLDAVALEADTPYFLVVTSFYGLESEEPFGTYELVVSVR